jgi:RNA polymerase sigma-70 factor (ECF subfamily)
VPYAEEDHWVRQAQAGDRQAFAALVEAYWTRVYRWLYGLTHNRHSAEELTQEAFLRAWMGLPELKEIATFRPWLFCIARNCLISVRRGPRGTPVQRLEDEATMDGGPIEEVLASEGQGLLELALGRMPALLRGAFLLWTQEDMPYPEVARALAITEETARWRVCKARQFLVKELEAYLDQTKP